MKVINKYDRTSLAEGRAYNMGFAFCKKLNDTTFQTVQPISPCKDYLNDVLFAEQTGEILPKIYGFKYSKINNILGRNYAYIAISICKGKFSWQKHYEENGEYKSDYKNLSKNYKNIQKALNSLEEQLGIEYKTKIIRAKGVFLVKMPKFWTKYIYLLSMYTLLLRVFQYYTKGDPLEYVKNGKVFGEDRYLFNDALPNINKILEGELPHQEITKGSSSQYIHNSCGIVTFKLNE